MSAGKGCLLKEESPFVHTLLLLSFSFAPKASAHTLERHHRLYREMDNMAAPEKMVEFISLIFWASPLYRGRSVNASLGTIYYCDVRLSLLSL